MTAKKLYKIRFDDTATGGPMTWVRRMHDGDVYVTAERAEAGLFTNDQFKTLKALAAEMARAQPIIVKRESIL